MLSVIISSDGQMAPYRLRTCFGIGIELSEQGSTRVNLVANNSLKIKY
jgi:hypothetical protein